MILGVEYVIIFQSTRPTESLVQIIFLTIVEVQSAEFLSYDRFCLYTCKSLGCKVKLGFVLDEGEADLEILFHQWGEFPFCTQALVA